MRNVLKWIWRLLLAAFIITVFVNNLANVQIALLLGVIILRVILVETDKTIY